MQLNTNIWVQRVPTKDNLSDLPSRRGTYVLLLVSLDTRRFVALQGGLQIAAGDQSRKSRARVGRRFH